MSGDPEHPALEELRRRLDEEEEAYAEVLAAVDRLAAFPLPAEAAPEIGERLEALNRLWTPPEPPAPAGLGARLRRGAWDALAPALERQTRFNSALVQLLNAYVEHAERTHQGLRELAGALVRYAQRVQPLVDARDRVASALATTRSELILEAFDRRLESLGRRLEGLLALRDRLETVSEEVRAVRGTLAAGKPPRAIASAASRAATDAVRTALEDRSRGSREEMRERLSGYVELFRGLAPVVALGCGRGELLELLREAGIQARGVDANANAARECRDKGLDVTEGDPVEFVRAQRTGAVGGVFGRRVAEQLPPPLLLALLAEAHRAIRPGGLLLLETANPGSLAGLLEAYGRELGHGRPLPPETLRFLAAAQGFSDVRIEMRTPVAPEARLQPVPGEDLPPRAAAALNENLERLNALLYGHLEYALVARK